MKKSDLIYIMAPSYTGSTLLTYLLAMHPEISTIGELKATSMGDIDKYTCSCDSLLRDCPFWNKVINIAEEKNITFSLDNFGTHFKGSNYFSNRVIKAGVKGAFLEQIRTLLISLIPGCRNTIHKIIEQNRLLIEIIKKIQQGDIFLDGSKDPNRLAYFINSNLWNIKVIYLIRDGRGTTNSYIRHNNVNMDTAAREWIHTHKECDKMANNLKERCLTIHYEKFCQAPDKMLADIFRFCNLDPEAGNIDFRAVKHHILGNSMRLASTSQIKMDEKWRTTLGPEQLEIFEKIAGKMNRNYHYN
jgi:hypothetical protein